MRRLLLALLAAAWPVLAAAQTPITVSKVCFGTCSAGPTDSKGTAATPEGSVAACVGSTYRKTNGTTDTALWRKETGACTSSGWVADAAPSVTATSTTTFTNKTITCYTVVAGLQHCGGSLALTDAQTKALPTTPTTLVAAPGSGKTIVVLSGGVFANNAAGAYTNVNTTGSQLEVYYTGDSSVWVLTPVINDSTTSPAIAHLTELLTGGGKVASVLIPYHDSPAVISNGWVIPPTINSTTYENKAVVVAIDNGGSGNITGGNAANTLTVYLEYWVVG